MERVRHAQPPESNTGLLLTDHLLAKSRPTKGSPSLPVTCYNHTRCCLALSSRFSRGPKTAPSMHDTTAETASSIYGPMVPPPPRGQEMPIYTRTTLKYAHAYATMMRGGCRVPLNCSPPVDPPSARHACSTPLPFPPQPNPAFMWQKTAIAPTTPR